MSTQTTEQPKVDKKPLDPLTKLVKIRKEPGQPWVVKFSGPIRKVDVNHLTRMLRVEYSRAQRRSRIQRRKDDKVVNSENTNG